MFLELITKQRVKVMAALGHQAVVYEKYLEHSYWHHSPLFATSLLKTLK